MYNDINRDEVIAENAQKLTELGAEVGQYSSDLQSISGHHAKEINNSRKDAVNSWVETNKSLMKSFFNPWNVARDAMEYSVDAAQRQVLFWDTMRQRGNVYNEHQAAGCPPVLAYDYETILDAREFDRPVNYALVRISPPEGVVVDETSRPYVIIDPRAGHGAGIGGFKGDSQVGVALRAGHPVYFVIFFQEPEPGQTLADVCDAEVSFVQEIVRLHPGAQKPVVVGNCQGGWAVMLLSASQPGLTGPLVLNGAPLSYWAGKNGKNPMRYMGGLFGGTMPAMLLSDLGNGKFDGAHLVSNFEKLNPANSNWGKYYKLYSTVDDESDRFLEFERWWGGFYLMNEGEMRWIVENLFVGNLLTAGQAQLTESKSLDLKHITAPIVVFASRGDNITPPQQALNWVPETYRDEHEIRSLGQRIVYMLHETIGHLGIFASSELALREHSAIMSTLDAMEALPPGLYEMKVVDRDGEGELRHKVNFIGRSMAELIVDIEVDERDDSFGPVSRLSSFSSANYEKFVRPVVQSMVTPQSAEILKQMHPLRRERYMFSDKNPWLAGMSGLANLVAANRQRASSDNMFVAMERNNSRAIHSVLDDYRQRRDAGYELAFHVVYGLPAVREFAKRLHNHDVERDHDFERHLPEIEGIVDRMEEGGFAEAVIRMVVQVSRARGGVPRARLKRFNEMITKEKAFSQFEELARSRMIYEQTVVSEMEPEKAERALLKMLPKAADRKRAIKLVDDVIGGLGELDEGHGKTWKRIQKLLGAKVVG